jgi:site-specific recombinase XerD
VTTTLTIATNPRSIFIPANADKDTRSRVGAFCTWLTETQRAWHSADLAAYRDQLLAAGKRATTVSAHLSSIRAAYGRVLRNNDVRGELFTAAGEELQRLGQADTPANRAAIVTERYTRLENGLDPKAAPVKLSKSQDQADGAQVRLTREQAEALLAAPGVMPLDALRDTCVIALMLCTGIREAELCALEVVDLRERLGGELALHVRQGKGRKERLIPYGELSWVLAVIDQWLTATHISEGRVFRSFWKGHQSIRGPLTARTVERIVRKYPVMIDGDLTPVAPHDLRRTYAARLYEVGVDLVAIKQNLGHADTRTTLLYIGELSADKRRAKGIYSFDLSVLKRLS